MRFSDEIFEGGAHFAFDIHKQPDGQFEATCPAHPRMGSVIAVNEREALWRMRNKAEEYFTSGRILGDDQRRGTR